MKHCTKRWQDEEERRNRMDEQTVSIPVKQYTECIMAIQKLNDVYKVACCNFDEDSYMTAIEAIQEISKPPYGGEQDAV